MNAIEEFALGRLCAVLHIAWAPACHTTILLFLDLEDMYGSIGTLRVLLSTMLAHMAIADLQYQLKWKGAVLLAHMHNCLSLTMSCVIYQCAAHSLDFS